MKKMNKRIVSLLTVLALVLAMMPAMAFADTASETAEVNVTIADKGNLVVTQETVTVTDSDADGTLTINDALHAAHESAYAGGAAAGYESAISSWGLAITKLWGDTSGSYGYYVNDASAWSLTDPVKAGDSVYAFVYADGVAWSDTYSFFDKKAVTAEEGQEVMLALSYNGYDANWNTVVAPLEGAVITVDGEATDIVTAVDGKAVITLEEGTHVISATSESMTLVPPVCIATVTAASGEEDGESPVIPDDGEQDTTDDTEGTPEDEDQTATEDEEGSDSEDEENIVTEDEESADPEEEPVAEAESAEADSTPQTGDDFNMALYGFVALAALAAAAFCLKRKTCK